MDRKNSPQHHGIQTCDNCGRECKSKKPNWANRIERLDDGNWTCPYCGFNNRVKEKIWKNQDDPYALYTTPNPEIPAKRRKGFPIDFYKYIDFARTKKLS